ncbi:MAG: phenylalanine--tRNA ligase subunit alpha [Clostridiales bacterium]|nr:phenylalanine--tRNA ligase subunit alpha [Clostridiales bacterium]
MSDLKESLLLTRKEFEEKLASLKDSNESEALRVEFFGKKGKLTAALRGMGQLSAEERPAAGKLINEVREKMEALFEQKQSEIREFEKSHKLKREVIDVTLPSKFEGAGSRHPLNMAINEICDIFLGLGYSIGEGPEVEYDKYNFELLRLPKGHPARDTQDTFYISDNILLRTQTSPMQIRIMEKQKPPIKVVCPGKVYRQDTLDSTHSPVFHQIEGLVVDKGVTMGDLVGSLRLFAKKLFGENTEIRLRPHHFPFTEPSVEVDLTCWSCGGKGCRVCKGEGWIEVLGAGMVHPEVLENCGIDSEEYSGFAFGIGVERTAMGRYGIDDIRLLYENDVRFLKQFK